MRPGGTAPTLGAWAASTWRNGCGCGTAGPWRATTSWCRCRAGAGRPSTSKTIDDDGRTFLRLTAVVGEASRLGDVRLRAALTLNAELHTGAIAISGDSLVLTDSFPVSSVDVDTLDAAMRFLAATADQYEGILFGTDAN